jgi:hypothetical protein
MKKANEFYQWVICDCEERYCEKSPCMAVIDKSINIDKFKECFWSNVHVKWRIATKGERTTVLEIRIRKMVEEEIKTRSSVGHNQAFKSDCGAVGDDKPNPFPNRTPIWRPGIGS